MDTFQQRYYKENQLSPQLILENKHPASVNHGDIVTLVGNDPSRKSTFCRTSASQQPFSSTEYAEDTVTWIFLLEDIHRLQYDIVNHHLSSVKICGTFRSGAWDSTTLNQHDKR